MDGTSNTTQGCGGPGSGYLTPDKPAAERRVHEVASASIAGRGAPYSYATPIARRGGYDTPMVHQTPSGKTHQIVVPSLQSPMNTPNPLQERGRRRRSRSHDSVSSRPVFTGNETNDASIRAAIEKLGPDAKPRSLDDLVLEGAFLWGAVNTDRRKKSAK